MSTMTATGVTLMISFVTHQQPPHRHYYSNPTGRTLTLFPSRYCYRYPIQTSSTLPPSSLPHLLSPSPPPPWLSINASRPAAFSAPPHAYLCAAVHDAAAAALVLAGGYALVSTFDNLTKRNVIPQSLSRKLVHILSGLLYMASWPLFSTSTEARYFASLAPLTNCLRLLVHGLSLATDEGLLKSVTREGKPEELLRGPLYYVMMLVLCAIVFWRESPVGVVSLAMMCGGDGVADIMGRKFGYVKIPYNRKKSWAGSISMFVFGFMISLGMLYYFSALGYFQLDWFLATERVALVSLVATLIESLPTTGVVDDNISVPLATMVTAYICFYL